jgi:transcriptional regulator with XRE-family HTH domain
VHQSELKLALIKLIEEVANEPGVTKEELAKKAGISASFLSMFLNRKRHFSREHVVNIIEALQNVSPELVKESGLINDFIRSQWGTPSNPVHHGSPVEMNHSDVADFLRLCDDHDVGISDLMYLQKNDYDAETVMDLIKRLARSAD